MKKRVLVVEDEEKLRRVVELQLVSAGFEVDKAATAEEGVKVVDRADLVLTDLRLPNMDGLGLLALIRRQNAQVPVVVMTAYGSIETAVECMKAGATDFLLKPFSLDHLMQVVHKALEVRALRDENRQLKEELGRRYEYDNIIGRSEPMQEIFATIERVAPTRRKRRRQRPDRARHSFSFPAPRSPPGEDQLHRHPREPDGERTVRLRKGRLHRRRYLQAWQVRAGRYRHRVSR
jgi:DNA-binding NtrC family response regulator